MAAPDLSMNGKGKDNRPTCSSIWRSISNLISSTLARISSMLFGLPNGVACSARKLALVK